MKRFLLWLGIFAASVLFMMVVAYVALLAIATQRATGIAIVKGSSSIIALLLICVLLGGFSYWLSGKFIR